MVFRYEYGTICPLESGPVRVQAFDRSCWSMNGRISTTQLYIGTSSESGVQIGSCQLTIP